MTTRRFRAINGSPVPSILASTVVGGLLAIGLAIGPAAGGSEPTVTGSILVAFGLGWALMTRLTRRFSNQPQPWMNVPAAFLASIGLGLVVLQPGPWLMDLAGWIWPPALFILAIWMFGQVRGSLRGGGRVPVVALTATLALMAVGGGITAIGSAVVPSASASAGQLVDVGGRRLYLECSGSGAPVVLLQAGLGESSPEWAQIAPEIATSTTVCAYDRAGHGRSDEAPAPQDAIVLAQDLHTLLGRAGIAGPYVLVGHSSGGAYVRGFAAQFPSEVAGMVLLDAQPADAFTTLPDYPATYQALRTAYSLSPSLARIGLLGPLLGLPGYQSTVEAARAARDELLVLPTSLQQALAVTTIGARPLVVVTAGTGQQRGWFAAQDRLVGLSTHAVHRTVATATHTSLITGADAGASIQAIRDVLAAVRTGATLL
jgi:pimeloyl-ACP methyl ester carboxylesterase